MNILDKIMAERRHDVAAAREKVPVDILKDQAGGRAHHSLVQRLASGPGPHIIAEMKKASPSAGLLRESYAPADIAKGYLDAGASAVSVLTEPRHFMGGEADLRAARAAVDLPILRKDFIGDEYQVYEAAAWGADLVLLIVAALSREEMHHLYAVACDCGLEVLVESHDMAELELALDLEKALIGVNNRNLKTLKTDLAVSMDLAGAIPAGRWAVAESGISCRGDIEKLAGVGYHACLIGEALVRGQNPAETLQKMRF